MQQHERDDADIDALDPDFLGRDTLQIEQRETERWRQKRGLQVDRDQHREPIDRRLLRHMVAEFHADDHPGKNRQNDQGYLQPIEEEAQRKDDPHDQEQQTPVAETGTEDQLLNDVVGNAKWLDKEVIALPTKRVRQVTVTHPKGETLHLSKAKPDDLDFHLDSIPTGFKVSSQFNVNNVVGTLVQLSLEDVKPQAEVDFSVEPVVSAILETFDGLRLHVHTSKQDEQVWGKFSAEFDANLIQPSESGAKPEDGQKSDGTKTEKGDKDTGTDVPKKESLLKKPEEVQQEVETLNQRVKDWAYALPSFRVENFSKLKKDLISKKE